MNELLRDRARGCAVGAAVGDALGMPFEFRPRQDGPITAMVDGRLPAGTFTDDTEMALAVAENLLAHAVLDPADLARRFAGWLAADPADVGAHTRAVLERVRAGEPWDEAVEAVQRARPDSAGNGALMRCWPVALAYWDDLDDLLVDSWLQSRVTHPHPDCLAASAFFNVTLYHVLRGTEPGWALILASTVVKMTDDMWRVIETAPYRERHQLENTGWVRHTLESAVWAVTTSESFEEAVGRASGLGNDADTSAAIAGALAGAYYGLAGIPTRWREALRGEWLPGSGYVWTADDFAGLADRLVALGERGTTDAT